MNDTALSPIASARLRAGSCHPTHPFRAGHVRSLHSQGKSTTQVAQLEACTSPDSNSLHGLCDAAMELFHAVNDVLHEEFDSAYIRLQRAAHALHVAPPSAKPGRRPAQGMRPGVRGGLAPWKARCLQTHIENHLDTGIRTRELARFVQLSSYHFHRAFRVSFGYSPHNYIMRLRIERAQGLMLTTNLPLGQIALDCGFADQAHLTKLFRKFAGDTPGRWRRARFETFFDGSPSGLSKNGIWVTALNARTGDEPRECPPTFV